MDQKCLYELEARCIQDWAPECTSACPIHVDVRAFIAHISRGDWSNAGKVIHRTLPLANVLGRICDAPCQKKCKLAEGREAINIGALERACVVLSGETPKPLLLPHKSHQVAIINSGISSLTVAWDLVRKGYDITIFEPGRILGGNLLDIQKNILPAGVLQKEIGLLITLGMKTVLDTPINKTDFIENTLSEFDVIYLFVSMPLYNLPGLYLWTKRESRLLNPSYS